MAVMNDMKGARLAYVCRPLKGKKKHRVHAWDSDAKKLVSIETEIEAGYMLYTPSGHSYRLTEQQVIRRGFDAQPEILNFDAVNDAKSPAGRFKFAINDETRKAAWRQMEEQVIALCKRRGGGSLELGAPA